MVVGATEEIEIENKYLFIHLLTLILLRSLLIIIVNSMMYGYSFVIFCILKNVHYCIYHKLDWRLLSINKYILISNWYRQRSRDGVKTGPSDLCLVGMKSRGFLRYLIFSQVGLYASSFIMYY